MRIDAGNDESRLKRYALQIAAQLPDGREEALRVLEYAKQLVEWEDEVLDASPVLQLIG